ncbi:hypothetical protein D4S03_06230 [bacterium]|nr:MAG: hypothetical protein D4S03_06230 [bacterium]
MFKRLLALIPIFLILLFPKSAMALGEKTFVTISNPVRGYEGWNHKLQTPLDLPKFQYQESTPSAFPVTWLLRYDAVESATMSAYFNTLIVSDPKQFLGAFLEITPLLTYKADVEYPEGISIFNANRIFLSGYTQEDRLLLIDTYMSAFFVRFGFYPKSVAAWDIDSFSLQYLQSKYSVLTAMNCDDQYSTDSYRIWGGYLGSPYFPDKNNSLIPASSLSNRVNLAMVRWAQRDLYNFYGYRTESSYSVQVNDYLSMGQSTKYFESLLNLYSQHSFNEFTYVNIGLENDYSLVDYRKEITNVYRSLQTNQGKFNLKFISLSDFGDWMKGRYPESSPAYFYRTTDPTGTEKGEVFWYQSPHYRIGLKSQNGKTKIIDFRVYNREIYEDNFATPNQNLALYNEIPAVVDSIKFPGSELTIDADFSGFKTIYDKQWDLWQVSLQNGGQIITFYPGSVSFTNISAPILKTDDIKVTNKKNVTNWKTTPYTPFKDTHNYSWFFWLILTLTIICIINKIRHRKLPKISLPLVVGLVCVAVLTLTVIKSGLIYPFGLGFWGPNGHDAVFHLSLIEKFAQNPLNLDHPQYARVRLTNYHFVFDYLGGLLVRLFSIPSGTFYFLIAPILLGLALVILLGKLMTKWSYSPLEKTLGYVLVFFSGSFGFIPKLITGQDIFAGESAFWANQSASLFLNPPFALSLIFLVLFLVNLPKEGKIKPFRFIKLMILGALLAQTKIYAFVLLEAALLIGKRFKLMFAIGLLGVLISLPFSSFSGLPFSFDPLWFPRSLFASFDRFYWPKFVEAWQAYEASGNFIKLLVVNIFATFAFIVGNLGMRVLGLFDMTKKPIDLSQKIIFAIILVGLILPLIIVQKVNPWNTIQFMYYSLFFLGLVTAKVISKITLSIKNVVLRACFFIIILLMATATSIGTLKDYVSSFSASRISFTEMQALKVLKNEPKGIVLSPLFKKADWVATPKPLYSYVSTAYISAFSGQPEFLSDTINLDITGIDFKEREREIQRFYGTRDIAWAKSFLKKNKIKYIIETPVQKMNLNAGNLLLPTIFDSGEISIYKIN